MEIYMSTKKYSSNFLYHWMIHSSGWYTQRSPIYKVSCIRFMQNLFHTVKLCGKLMRIIYIFFLKKNKLENKELYVLVVGEMNNELVNIINLINSWLRLVALSFVCLMCILDGTNGKLMVT